MANLIIKWVLSRLKGFFKLDLYKVGQIWKLCSNSKFLNAIRRCIGFCKIGLEFSLKQTKGKLLKLHLGCGDKHFDNYINIDIRKTRATDLVCNITKMPYPDNSAEVIESYHVIEHLPFRDFNRALNEWHRILAPGGKLIIECPDFDKALTEYSEGNDERLFSIFGRQRFKGDAHHWGFNARRLIEHLGMAGFIGVYIKDPQDYHKNFEPCLRVEGFKSKSQS